MADISTGADAVVDEVFSYQKVNKLKNHYYAAAAPADPVAGVMWIDSDDDLVYRYDGAAWATVGQGDFADGGEVGGAKRTLGNTDANIMAFITNNVDVIHMSAAGEVTMPLTPAFLAYNSAQDPNVTGDGTAFTVIFDTERFDQGADFDGTSTFTASVTGRYRLETSIEFENLHSDTFTEMLIQIVTSNKTHDIFKMLDTNIHVGGNVVIGGSVLADMDAADTATIVVTVTGGTKIVYVGTESYFSGNLEC